MSIAMGLILIGGIAVSILWGARRASISQSRLLNIALENGWRIAFSNSGLIQVSFGNCVVSIEYAIPTDDMPAVNLRTQRVSEQFVDRQVVRAISCNGDFRERWCLR